MSQLRAADGTVLCDHDGDHEGGHGRQVEGIGFLDQHADDHHDLDHIDQHDHHHEHD